MKHWPIVVVSLIAFLASSHSRAEEVVSPPGKMQIGTALKFLYGYSKQDDDTQNPGREQFTTALLDLNIDAELTDRIGINVELATSWNQDTATGGFNGPSGYNELGQVGLRQASIIFREMIPWTTVELGTFIPPITNYMPRPVTQLDMIQYPLLNNAVLMNTGTVGNRAANKRDMSTWQQAGINVTIESPYMIRLDLGIWNGVMPNYLANTNENIAKASSVVGTFMPRDNISLAIAFWGEEFQAAFPGIASGAKRNLTMWSLYGTYQTDLFEVTADYSSAIVNEFQIDNKGDFRDLTGNAWQITAGYWIRPDIEILGRVEYINPNAEDSPALPQSRYDESTWYTAGLNWRFNGRGELALNYVFKTETGRKVDKGKAGEDPNLPGYNPKFGAQENDLFLLQVMIWH